MNTHCIWGSNLIPSNLHNPANDQRPTSGSLAELSNPSKRSQRPFSNDLRGSHSFHLFSICFWTSLKSRPGCPPEWGWRGPALSQQKNVRNPRQTPHNILVEESCSHGNSWQDSITLIGWLLMGKCCLVLAWHLKTGTLPQTPKQHLKNPQQNHQLFFSHFLNQTKKNPTTSKPKKCNPLRATSTQPHRSLSSPPRRWLQRYPQRQGPLRVELLLSNLGMIPTSSGGSQSKKV